MKVMFVDFIKKKMAHPLLLEGTDLSSWETFIPENLNLLFAPNMSGVVKDIIKLGPGKYIVTFTTANSLMCGFYRELYYDSARIIFKSDFVFDVSIADITKRYYLHAEPFKTSAPYMGLTGPVILYKGPRRRYTCEYNETEFMSKNR
jgi:hypothetical protein